jgi:hypothetical protein
LKHTNFYEGTKKHGDYQKETMETHQLLQRYQGTTLTANMVDRNTPSSTNGPRELSNCFNGTNESHQLLRRDQANTPTAKKGPWKHPIYYEGTKDKHQLLRRDQGYTPTA